MTKLTMHDRVKIVRLMMQDTRGKAIADAGAAVAAASEAAYIAFYGDDLAKINSLPDGWFATRDRASVRFKGARIEIDFNNTGRVHIRLPGNDNDFWLNTLPNDAPRPVRVERRFLYTHLGYDDVVVNEGHPAFGAFQELMNAIMAKDKLLSEIKTNAEQVFNVLKTFMTAEAAKTKWPEIAPYVAQVVVGDRQSTALAPNFTALNKTLGLPVDG